jgi:osmotically-inducible protein OsmY
MQRDHEIRQEIQEGFEQDSHLGVRYIAVVVRDGVVTLTGFVRSLLEKSRAETITRRVAGVRGLANDIEIRLPIFGRKLDPEIAREVLAYISKEMPTVGEHICVRVANGHLTLEGEVESEDQKVRAEELVASVHGVRTITNDLVIGLPILTLGIKQQIEDAFKRAAEVDADTITVEIAPAGTIVLGGIVRSQLEREEAERIARLEPGILTVVNRIEVAT